MLVVILGIGIIGYYLGVGYGAEHWRDYVGKPAPAPIVLVDPAERGH